MRAKYFIAHVLTGDLARYHTKLTRKISHQFRTAPLHEKIAPHITVKIPFEATRTEIAGVEHLLDDFTKREYATPLTVQGFGRFGHRTVYMDAQHTRESVDLVRACIRHINTLRWIQKVPHEGNKLHASVARFLKPHQFRRIWRLLRNEAPSFTTTLDSLSLFTKDTQGLWYPYRTFTFHNTPSYHSSELIQLSRESFSRAFHYER
jgi:2'-5' RNA ligase